MWTWQRAFSLDCVTGISIGKGKGVIKEGTQLKGTHCVLTNAFISLFLSPSTACHTGTCLRLTLDSREAVVELQ